MRTNFSITNRDRLNKLLKPNKKISNYVVPTGNRTGIEAVLDNLCRASGLRVCGCRSDGYDPRDGTETYQVSLGTPCRSGGYTPEWSGFVYVS